MEEKQLSLFDLLMDFKENTSVQSQKEQVSIEAAFREASKSYDIFQVTSAFHKELRRADAEKAFYWAAVLEWNRGLFYVLRYMFQVSTEETLSPELKTKMTEYFYAYKDYTGQNLQAIYKMIKMFCSYPYCRHTSDLGDRIYQKQSQYWRTVAKDKKNKTRRFTGKPELIEKWAKKLPQSINKEVIGVYSTAEVIALFEEFIAEGELFKALYLLYCADDIIESIYPYVGELFKGNIRTEKLYNALGKNKVLSKHTFWTFDFEILLSHVMHKFDDTIPVIDIETPTDREAEKAIEHLYDDFAENGAREIPFYALDRHTKAGKTVYFSQRSEIKPNRPYSVMDLRYAAEWVSVMWRYQAFKQHGTIMVAWEDVKLDESIYYEALWHDIYNAERVEET